MNSTLPYQPPAPPSPSDPLLDWALWYATVHHWAVFPCIGKNPLTSKGFHDASSDPAVIRAWWTRWPSANIAAPNGPINGFSTLDIDPHNQGTQSLAKLVATHGPLPLGGHVQSGGADRGHHYHWHTGLEAYARKTGRLAPGVDLLGYGGYVLLPPSRHPDTGRAYAWLDDPAAPLPPIPEWVVAWYADDAQQRRYAEQTGTEVSHGRRNATLTSFAGTMRRRGAGREAILAALRAENQEKVKPPLEDEELRKIVEHICRYAPSLTSGEAKADLGNAHRLVALYGHLMRYDPEGRSEGWLIWNGHYWLSGRRAYNEVRYLAELTTNAIAEEAIACQDLGERQALMKWAHASKTRARIDGMVSLAEPMPEVRVEREWFDREPMLLNCANGTLDLTLDAPLRFYPHRQDDYLTLLTPVSYDPDATCPTWEHTMRDVFSDDVALLTHFQRLMGYCLTGDTRHHHFWVCWGGGRNGKDTVLSRLKELLGPYAIEFATEALVATGRFNVEYERARLRGARLAIASETAESTTLNTDAVKYLTGGNVVRGRTIYTSPSEFQPTHKLILQTNNKPLVHENTVAVWERIRLVPFLKTYPVGVADTTLPWKLQRELPGILNWAVRGCLEWQQLGYDLGVPPVVGTATEAYRNQEDQIGAFLREECELVSGEKESCREVLLRYNAWCKQMRERPLGRNAFYDAVVEHGVERGRGTDNKMMFFGLRLGGFRLVLGAAAQN